MLTLFYKCVVERFFLQASLLGKGYFKRKVLQYYRRFKLEPQLEPLKSRIAL